MSSSRSVLRVWSLALALSVLLAAAGERWPEPLPVRPGLVWALVLLPPLLIALLLLPGWSLPQAGTADAASESQAEAGASGQGGESDPLTRENG